MDKSRSICDLFFFYKPVHTLIASSSKKLTKPIKNKRMQHITAFPNYMTMHWPRRKKKKSVSKVPFHNVKFLVAFASTVYLVPSTSARRRRLLQSPYRANLSNEVYILADFPLTFTYVGILHRPHLAIYESMRLNSMRILTISRTIFFILEKFHAQSNSQYICVSNVDIDSVSLFFFNYVWNIFFLVN